MSEQLPENIRAAIIAGSQGGKTSLAIGFSRGLWRRYGLRTLAFDPWLKESPRRWGAHAWATDEMEKFEHVVFRVRGCAVFWDEGSSTGGRDRDKVRFFTAIRHAHPAFFFLGHNYSAMLPIMRASLTDLFLAASSPDDAEQWAAEMRDPYLRQAAAVNQDGTPYLAQYTFMHKRAFRQVKTLAHTPAQLSAGILP